MHAATAKSNASGPREDAVDRRPDDRSGVLRVSVSPLGVTCESDALYVHAELRISVYTLGFNTWATRQRADVFCKRRNRPM